ncbi:MAG: hypothetical protein Q7U97_11535 [Rhodocyclaceae bacterium]|nr:hypothetical protein [Rhodocyclaceae bacterium]
MNESQETSSGNFGYSADNIEHFERSLRDLQNAQPNVQLDLHDLAEHLSAARARTFASEALGRRLPVIQQAVLNVFHIYSPDRKEFLTQVECTNIAIQLQAFAINVYAIFDNAAWICMLEAGGNLPAIKVGLFRTEIRKFLPAKLADYIDQPTVKRWFDEYGKIYRDSTAHRIPPYLPSRAYTTEEGARFREIHDQSMALLYGWRPGESLEQVEERLARHRELEAEKEQLGRNSLLFGLTLTGEDAKAPVYLHPQLLCDWGLVHEFVQAFTQAMREHYRLVAPHLPPISAGS